MPAKMRVPKRVRAGSAGYFFRIANLTPEKMSGFFSDTNEGVVT